MTEPMSPEELEAKALADYEANVAQINAAPKATEVRLELDGQVYTYLSAGGTGRDKYLREVAKRLAKRRVQIEEHLELLRQKEAGL